MPSLNLAQPFSSGVSKAPSHSGWTKKEKSRAKWTSHCTMFSPRDCRSASGVTLAAQDGQSVHLKKGVREQGLLWWFRWWRICLQCRGPWLNSWVGKIPWRRKWLPTPVSLPGESHRQRRPEGYSLWDCKERHDWATNTFTLHRDPTHSPALDLLHHRWLSLGVLCARDN